MWSLLQQCIITISLAISYISQNLWEGTNTNATIVLYKSRLQLGSSMSCLIAVEVVVVVWGADWILVVTCDLECTLIHNGTGNDSLEQILFPFDINIVASNIVG